MQIMKFKSLDEFIDRAHDTVYGLAASVFTRDLEKAIYLSNSLRAGTVWSVCAECSFLCMCVCVFYYPLREIWAALPGESYLQQLQEQRYLILAVCGIFLGV